MDKVLGQQTITPVGTLMILDSIFKYINVELVSTLQL